MFFFCYVVCVMYIYRIPLHVYNTVVQLKYYLFLLQLDAVSHEYQLHSIQSEHKKTITAIAWCPHDVDVIVSTGADLAVIIWNVAEQQVLANVTLGDGMAVPCSIAWGMPNPTGVAFVGKRGPLMMWFSTDECDEHRVTASHSEIKGFSSDVCQMRCHPRQRDKVALGHVDGSVSIFAASKCHISVPILEYRLL